MTHRQCIHGNTHEGCSTCYAAWLAERCADGEVEIATLRERLEAAERELRKWELRDRDTVFGPGGKHVLSRPVPERVRAAEIRAEKAESERDTARADLAAWKELAETIWGAPIEKPDWPRRARQIADTGDYDEDPSYLKLEKELERDNALAYAAAIELDRIRLHPETVHWIRRAVITLITPDNVRADLDRAYPEKEEAT